MNPRLVVCGPDSFDPALPEGARLSRIPTDATAGSALATAERTLGEVTIDGDATDESAIDGDVLATADLVVVSTAVSPTAASWPDCPVVPVGPVADTGWASVIAADPYTLPPPPGVEVGDWLETVLEERAATIDPVRIEHLHQVAIDLTEADDEQAVYDRTVEAAEDILSFDLCVLGIVRDGRFRLGAVSEELSDDGYHEPRIDSEEAGIAGRSYRDGRSILVRHVAEHPDANPADAYESAISVPMDEVGVIQVVAYEPDAFDERDRDLLELLATHATQAVSRIRASRDLARQNERLEEFASVLSHDLRNPLTVAAGSVELARETGELAPLADAVEAHDRIEAIVDRTLTLARHGRDVIDPEPVDLRTCSRRAWRSTATDDVAFEPPEAFELDADPDRLRRLFENCFANAITHGDDGTLTTVGVEVESGAFAVVDDGCGFDCRDPETLFDRGVTTDEDGTGLGLAIVDRIADAHGWSVRAEEAATGGARIVVEL